MAVNFPQRHEAHQLADESEQFFRRHLPANWTCDKPGQDYGIDLRVGLANGNQLNGQSLVVQLKATTAMRPGPTVSARLSIATFNYLWNLLEVAMLVCYVAEEQEAYWILLKDVPEPIQAQKTFTVHLPRANRVSNRPWEQVAAYVADVHQRKRDAQAHWLRQQR